MITQNDFVVSGTKPATKGPTPNWDAAHKWIQCFADWSEHTKVFTVELLDPGTNQTLIEWDVLADCDYQAIQTAYSLWDKIPEEEKLSIQGLDLLDDEE